MKAFYSLLTVEADFQHVRTYEDIDGRRVSLIVGRDRVPVITAIDATDSDGAGVPGHQVLAILELNTHEVHDETKYSEGDFWQAEDFNFEPMRAVMRANLAARCGVKLLEGDELAAVKAAEERKRILQMYKIMRTEPPEDLAG